MSVQRFPCECELANALKVVDCLKIFFELVVHRHSLGCLIEDLNVGRLDWTDVSLLVAAMFPRIPSGASS